MIKINLVFIYLMFYIILNKSFRTVYTSSIKNNVNKSMTYHNGFLIPLEVGVGGAKVAPTDCLIYNQDYPNEYLYIGNELDRFRYERTNYLERIQPTQQAIKYSIYTYPLKFIENYDLIKWSLIPISSKRNDTFYIMNQMKNTYLCASSYHSDIFNMRRKIDLMKLSKDFKDRAKCMWRLDG